MAAVQIYTENHARGTEENLHSSRVFSRSLAVDSTPSLFKVIILFRGKSFSLASKTKGKKDHLIAGYVLS